MVKLFTDNKLSLILIHVAIGFVAQFSFFPKLFGAAIVVVGVLTIISSKNMREEALMFAGYMVGAEVFLRMIRGNILYETGKYSVLLFLIIGIVVGKNTNKPNVLFVFYILLLLLGITLTSVPEGESIRNQIAFNLSGPIVLGLCSFYFYKRQITKEMLFDILFFMLLPIIAMTSYLYFRTPSIEEIVFNATANFDTSGGFGPNQVATILGVGIFIVAVFLISKRKLTGYNIVDGIILVYLIYRGLLTFSRGGILSGAIAVFFFLIFYLLSQKQSFKLLLKITGISIFVLVGIWLYTSNITGGMLDNRYTGKNSRGIQKKDITTGRLNIFKEQLNSFYESPIVGIGVGNGKYKRQLSAKNVTAASHNELGRLIEEHGFIGLLSLFLLIGAPSSIFFKVDNYRKAFIVSFFLLWLLTIGHSAMRIAFPGFIYGLSLINIIDEEE
ncbi:MAG: O-antigen ligase family protein [Flavobacteriaceae bacterium]